MYSHVIQQERVVRHKHMRGQQNICQQDTATAAAMSESREPIEGSHLQR